MTFCGIISATSVLADDDDDDYDGIPWLTEEEIEVLLFNFDEVVETVVFFSAIAATLLILFGLSIALRLPRWTTYVALTLVSMVWLILLEQHLTGQIWTGVKLEQHLLVQMGFGLASLHVIAAARAILPSERFGWIRYALWAIAGGILVFLAINQLGASRPGPVSYYVIAALALISHLAAVPSILSLRGETNKVSRTGFTFAFIAAGGCLIAVLFGELSEEIDLLFLLRLAFLAVVIFYILFFARYVMAVLFERDVNAKRAVEAAKRDALRSKELLEAEKKYARARETARLHTMRLATASHDIRQPIASLRATMDAVALDQTSETRDQLRAAFDYLDDLAKSYLDPGDPKDTKEDRFVPSDDGQEDVDTTIIVATIDRMFRKEAEMKALTFHASTDEACLRVQPLVLTRILSNLVSNAIQHTAEGKVELNGKSKETGFTFTVTNDASLPKDAEGQGLFDPFVKTSESEGTGLGLSIVDSLIQHSGWRLSWDSAPDNGTIFEVWIPNGSRS